MFNWFKSLQKRWMSVDDGINSGLSSGPTLSGVSVTEDGSLAITGVWCAANTISSLIAGLPLGMYQHLPRGGKREAEEHPLYELLRYSPNPEVSKESFWQTMLVNCLLHGNGYAEIERDQAGRAVALWLLCPERVKACRDPELGLLYEVRQDGGSKVYLLGDNLFHLAGVGPDGLTGYSPIRLARESLGLTQALERFGASFFGNAARPAGVLTSPVELSQQARENLRKSWEALHTGTANTGRTAILEQGLSWQSISIPAEDAQYLESRRFQLGEIARIFNINPVFLHSESTVSWTTGTALETLNRQLVQISLMPWMQKIESQVRRKLISKDERQSYFAEHDVTNLLRSDTLSRYQAYQIAITSGWMLRSEARAEERFDPIDGIDEPVLPTKVQELTPDGTQVTQKPAATTQPDKG